MTGAREYGDALIASSSSVTRKLHGIGPHIALSLFGKIMNKDESEFQHFGHWPRF